ncbi:3-keto-5-aminohexanoate cleavage protein [Paraburkholderia silvatlantica]|uniref:3-keto-5-aminohexanoate cleavage protein n=1 Tax=Paraburkholderia silvatlantica TaxID=321895 RepID=UPI003751E1A8
MSQPTIISCALTGAADTRRINPAVPVTPEEIAREAVAAARAGAAVVHIHVRDPATGNASMEHRYYAEVVERIRDAGLDVIVNLTTGPGAKFIPSLDNPKVAAPGSTSVSPAERVAHVLELRPDVCSLDVTTMNQPNGAFVNTPEHLIEMARLIDRAGVRTEVEVFDLGDLRLATHLIGSGKIPAPALFQFCLGVSWGAPATPQTLALMMSQHTLNVPWSAFGVSKDQFPIAAQAVTLGGNVRVGLEDNLYLRRGVLAPGNGALVERAALIIELLGGDVATPAQARDMMGLVPKRADTAAAAGIDQRRVTQ